MGKKEKIFITVLVALTAILTLAYFFMEQWCPIEGSKGHYSAETYLDGGTGSYHFSKRTRVHYNYVIESGGICFELKDEQGTVVYERQFRESGSGYMTFEDVEPGSYYYHEYALGEDTVAHINTAIERKRNNFLLMLKKWNERSGYRLFGLDFLED